MHKLLIVTASEDTLSWKTLNKKIKDISKVLNTVQNGTFEETVVFRELKPEVVNGRITHKWFDWFSFPFYENGYDFVVLHFNSKQKKEWGISPTLGGSSHTNDGDLVGEAWFWADEKVKRKGQIRLVETCLHEMSHLIAKGTKIEDKTHAEDKKKSTVKALFKSYDMSLYLKAEKEIEVKKTLLQKLLAMLKIIETPQPFLKGNYRITQEFGVYNPIYIQTQHHIGLDIATPIGTPVYAPLDGTLSQSVGKETGIVATLETKQGTYQFLHLSNCVGEGLYKKGDVIAYTGNTGTKTTGAHVCVRKWVGTPNIAILTKDNFKNYLTNPI